MIRFAKPDKTAIAFWGLMALGVTLTIVSIFGNGAY